MQEDIFSTDKKLIPKKSLGQHFLRSEKALKTIVENISTSTKYIFEIGPGEGVLTEKLLKTGKTVLAIEIDKRSMEILKEKFATHIENKKLFIIERDCLEMDYGEEINNQEYSLVGNIPYYITGAIFRHSVEQKTLPREIIFLIQKEVAQRITAQDKKESILSVSLKVFSTDIKILDIVKAGSFVPPPKVDSAILAIKEIQNPFHSQKHYTEFFKILKAAFAHKRKFTLSNIKNELGEDVKAKLSSFITEKQRAEDIPLDVWKKIISSIS